MPTPLVKMLTHRGPVSALAIDPSGRYMASSGPDSYFKIWDLRMYKETHSYLTHRPVTSLEVSQRGLLAVGFGSHLQVSFTVVLQHFVDLILLFSFNIMAVKYILVHCRCGEMLLQ
jgi:WD40 repeat protein